jgi:hypothetical protein
MSDLHGDAPPNLLGRFVRERFADERAKPAGYIPVMGECCAPGPGAGKAILMPRRSVWRHLKAKTAQISHLTGR